MKPIYSKLVAIIIIIIGLVAIVSAFFSQMEFQVALALAGAAFIFYGIVQYGKVLERQKDEERYRQLMDKLEEIRLELEKKEQPKGTGVAIADVISSGLKYYAEHIAQPKQEDKND